MTEERLINHEVRIRMMEEVIKDIRQLMRWLIGIGLTVVIIPVSLHYLRLM